MANKKDKQQYKITTTLRDLDEAYPAIAKFSAETKLPVKLSYRVAKLLRKAKVEIKTYEDVRLETIKRLGAYNKDEDTWKVKPQNNEKYKQEIDELLAHEITLDGVHMISIDELEELELEIEPMVLAGLDLLMEQAE